MIDLNFYKDLKKYQEEYMFCRYTTRNQQFVHELTNGKNRKEFINDLKNMTKTQLKNYNDFYFKSYIKYFQFDWAVFLH